MKRPDHVKAGNSGYDWSGAPAHSPAMPERRGRNRKIMVAAGIVAASALTIPAALVAASFIDLGDAGPADAAAIVQPAATAAGAEPAKAAPIEAAEKSVSETDSRTAAASVAADVPAQPADADRTAAAASVAADAPAVPQPAAAAAPGEAATAADAATAATAVTAELAGPRGAEPDVSIPSKDDPRWAKSVKAESQAMLTAAEAQATLQAFASERKPDAGRAGDEADLTRTASIPPQEAILEKVRKTPEPKEEPAAPAISGDAPSSRATISTAVKLRSRPSNGGKVLTVLPAGAKVGLVDCDSWCEVVYGDRRGFVYKRFVGAGTGKAEATAAAEPVETTPPSKPKIEPARSLDVNRIGR